jgi:hypothetical protein
LIDIETGLRVLASGQVEFIVVGDLDLLGKITGGGGYEALLPVSAPVAAFGVELRCLNLEPLIHVKRAAGRPKDLEAIAELQALLEERQRSS